MKFIHLYFKDWKFVNLEFDSLQQGIVILKLVNGYYLSILQLQMLKSWFSFMDFTDFIEYGFISYLFILSSFYQSVELVFHF